jgi:hypothetical protein
MSKLTNYMMDIEEFCGEYYYTDFTIDEMVEDVGAYFKTNMAQEYARQYLNEQMGIDQH